MERLKKILKIIVGVCLVVLIIEFGYVFYNLIIDLISYFLLINA